MTWEKNMKKLALVCAVMVAQFVSAQEKVPLEEAQKGARLLNESAGTIAEPQVKVDLDFDKPMAFKTDKVGFLTVPDKKFTTETLSKVGTNVMPVGQLWMMIAAPAKDGAVIPNHKLRLITVRQKDKEAQLQMYFLGARKAEKEGLELVLYGKDKEPLLQLPLTKAEGAQDTPIEIGGRKDDDSSGTLTLNLLGKYHAEFKVMKQED